MPSSSLQILSAQHELSLTLNSQYGLNELLEKFAQTVSQRYLLRNVHYYFLDFDSTLLEENCIKLEGHTIKSLNSVNVSLTFHTAMIERHLEHYEGKNSKFEKGIPTKEISDTSVKFNNPNNNNSCLLIQIPEHGFIVFESINEVPQQQISSLLPLVNILADKSTACVEKQALKESVSQLERSHKLIYKQFYYDELTGLPNRKLLLKEFSVQTNIALNSSAYILFRINQLERLNTKYGYETIDQFLIKTCDIFADNLSERGTIYRVSGDEFLVTIDRIINGSETPIDQKKLSDTFVKINTEINSLRISGLSLNADIVSVASIFNDSAVEYSEVLNHLHYAMSKLEFEEKNSHLIITDEIREQFEYEHNIHNILSDEIPFDELRLVFQPQYSSAGDIIGAEILTRWKNEQLGDIPPFLFISLLEKSKKITQLDKFVAETAISTQEKITKDIGHCPHFAVNISSISLASTKFLNNLENLPSKDSKLNIELTESVLFDDQEALTSIFQRLNKKGITIHLDDFGTGHSSISYLMTLREGTIKIDRSFVQAIHLDERKQKLVKSIISLAETCGLDVIAEGTEEKEEVDCLIELGIVAFQGFYFSKPLEYDQFVALLEISQPKDTETDTKILYTGITSEQDEQPLTTPQANSTPKQKSNKVDVKLDS